MAIANTGKDRIHEYAPTAGAIYESALEERRSRGLAKKYGQFLIEELKPFIDQKYRTRSEAEFTGLGGSSMGGLLTLALGLWFPAFFRRLMVMSPAVWWDDQAILRMIEELDERLPLKIWLDTGTNETGWERARKLRDRLVEKGWLLFHDLEYCEAEGADHNEACLGSPRRIGPEVLVSAAVAQDEETVAEAGSERSRGLGGSRKLCSAKRGDVVWGQGGPECSLGVRRRFCSSARQSFRACGISRSAP